MKFEEAYLKGLVNNNSKSFLNKFSSRKKHLTENELKQVVKEISKISSIIVESDFDHYGSGYSSYVHLYLSKEDKSDVKVITGNNLRREEINGVMMYLCRIAPFGVFAEGNWENTYRGEEFVSAGSHFIEPEELETLPIGDWQTEMKQITSILDQYGIRFLTKTEVIENLDFEIKIPTILSDPPYKVFDCFFHWAD